MALILPSPRQVALSLLMVAVAAMLSVHAAPARASEVAYIINDAPLTSYDISRRAAFLRLQQRPSGNEAAAQEMIDEVLRRQEMARLQIEIPDQAVDEAYNNFASSNNLSTSQLDQILSQTGVTRQHFREYIRTQIGWSQAITSRFRAEDQISEQEVARRLIEQGGQKPTATEYLLQQVIFVVPEAERNAILSRRKREAEAMRAQFRGCEFTRDQAKQVIDVTVRELGRILELELPPDWADFIKETPVGGATKVRETPRGIEFIAICSSREVSDDRVAQMKFQREGGTEQVATDLDEKYMAELRERARIIER